MERSDTIARCRAHMPEGTQAILNTRSLTNAHRRLAELLQPGQTVLDVGCGTGAITRGVAEAVSPNGRVIGVDVNVDLIAEARRTHSDVPGLSFEVGDGYTLSFRNTFDIVTAARLFQWLSHPVEVLQRMVAAVKPGGIVLVLDYNHEKITWQPAPPQSMHVFYAAFLRWRSEAGMDNAIANHLAEMFAEVGLGDIQETPQHETTRRGDPDFAIRIGMWADVVASRGYQMVQVGVLTEHQRAVAESEYRVWIRDEAQAQTLYLVAVEGRRPR